ncbi:hypothetical protein HY346_00110 [Candidatus Microgenomates bacterium]|nr:hypothetical protein [Candidatus Microgenomates bacterium]
MLMRTDFLASLIILGITGLILHWKSHLKFIVLGLFVGIVLAETVAPAVFGYLGDRWTGFSGVGTFNGLQLAFLLIPAALLGINHLSDRRKLGLSKMVVYAAITTLLLLASIIKFLPEGWQFAVVSRSIIAFQLLAFHSWLLVLGAGLVIVDSFHHRKYGKRKSKKSQKSLVD